MTARARLIARTDRGSRDLPAGQRLSKSDTQRIIATVLDEEGNPPESLFDFVQGITAVARGKAHQDDRLEFEGKARKLLERAH